MGAGVQPCDAATEDLHAQLAASQVLEVDVGDLVLAASGGTQRGGDVEHGVVVEVQAGHGDTGLRCDRFLLDADHATVCVDFRHAVTFGVADVIAEDGRTSRLRVRALHQLDDAGSVEDVVAQDQRRAVIADELAPDDERLRETVRLGLLGVLQVQSPLRSVAEQGAEARQVGGGRDEQDVSDAPQHEHGQRMIDHRLVVDGEQLLAHRDRDRMKARPRAAGEDDPLPTPRHRALPRPTRSPR